MNINEFNIKYKNYLPNRYIHLLFREINGKIYTSSYTVFKSILSHNGIARKKLNDYILNEAKTYLNNYKL